MGDEDARPANDICKPARGAGWQQHKVSVRLGSGPGSNMHIMQWLWLAGEVRVGGPLSIVRRTDLADYILGSTLEEQTVNSVASLKYSSTRSAVPWLCFVRLDLDPAFWSQRRTESLGPISG